jgi:hypothetical protein
MVYRFMVDDLSKIALIDRLAAIRTGIEVVGLCPRWFAAHQLADDRAEFDLLHIDGNAQMRGSMSPNGQNRSPTLENAAARAPIAS